jgi:hypothetical protein
MRAILLFCIVQIARPSLVPPCVLHGERHSFLASAPVQPSFIAEIPASALAIPFIRNWHSIR